MIHICTTDSLLAGGFTIKSQCWICLKVCDQECGYAFTRCSSCRKCYDSEMGWGRLVMAQRELLGLTRKQLGEQLGLSPKTIKKYEWTYPSKRYKKAIEEAVGRRA